MAGDRFGGLEGVVAAETVLSHVDGERGRPVIRGIPLEILTRQGFESAIALLWDGFVANGLSASEITGGLGSARERAFSDLERWLPAARRPPWAFRATRWSRSSP